MTLLLPPKPGVTLAAKVVPMPRLRKHRVALWGVLIGTSLAVAAVAAGACTGGSGGSFGSNDPGGDSAVVSGQSDTSGVSAGTALQPPSATPTRAP